MVNVMLLIVFREISLTPSHRIQQASRNGGEEEGCPWVGRVAAVAGDLGLVGMLLGCEGGGAGGGAF